MATVNNGRPVLAVVSREMPSDKKYGLGTAVGRILKGLSRHGYEVHYLSCAESAAYHFKWQSRINKILSFLGPLAPAITERIIQGVFSAQRVVELGSTHVWIQDPWLYFGLKLGLLRRGIYKAPFKLIVSEHGFGSFAWAVSQDGLSIPSWVYRPLLRWEKKVLAKADLTIFPSRAAKVAAARDMGFVSPPDSWVVLGYGKPELQVVEKSLARQQLGISAEEIVIAALGRVSPVKKLNMLIDAVHMLQSRGHIARLMIVGEGAVEQLKQDSRIDELVLEPVIGAQSDVSVALSAADVYASACDVESFGMANREAVAAGLPCVVAAGGASIEVLGTGAWLIPNSPEFFCEAFEQILSTPSLREYWQIQANKAASSWPSWDEVIQLYDDQFRSV
jgi:glycosyltransferase involved in cell wall biosynthesis